MKKQLREELMALAKKIVQSGTENSTTAELKETARVLYEKLIVLGAAESFVPESVPVETEKAQPPVKAPEELKAVPTEKQQPEHEEEHDEHAPDGTQFNDSDDLHEPNTEKIKDIVAQMPPDSEKVDEILEYILPRKYEKNDMENIGGVHYDHLPQFERAHSNTPESPKPRSLNDRLKKGIQIGINDRLAFVRHLFEGSTSDYNRVLSQLNTYNSVEEARDFLERIVKPDYKNWEGKEVYEKRFLNLVENRFE